MFGLGAGEILVILVVALLVLGPQKLPEVAAQIARMLGELRRVADDVRQQFDGATEDHHGRPPLGAGLEPPPSVGDPSHEGLLPPEAKQAIPAPPRQLPPAAEPAPAATPPAESPDGPANKPEDGKA